MFINTGKMRRLMKEAYKTQGLAVYRGDGRVTISGTWFEFQIQEKLLPYAIKAAVVELAGDMPEEGEGILLRKDAPIQYIAPGVYPTKYTDREPVTVTCLLTCSHGEYARCLQKREGTICLMNEAHYRMIEQGATEEDRCWDPVIADEKILFESAKMSMAFMQMRAERLEAYMEHLEREEIPGAV